MSKVLSSPIRKNIAANLLGIGVNLLNQIALVPFFILLWGKALYSDWLVISSLSLFFALTDVGFNSVVQNRFVISFAKKNQLECNSLIISDIVVVSFVTIVSFIFAFLFISLLDISKILGLSTLDRAQSSGVFLLLLCQVFINMFNGVPNAVFRAFQRNHQAVCFDQIGRFGVFLLSLISLLIHLDIILMAAIINIPLLITLFIKYHIAYKLFVFKWPSEGLDFSLIKIVFLQGLGFLSFPAANAIILQGFTLVVNRYFGAESVVLYSTTRTMCNFVKTLLSTVLNSVWPEFSIAYGHRDSKRMYQLYHKSIKISIICGAMISILILLFGPYIYKIWTHGTVNFNFNLMLAFLIVLMVNTLWNSGSVALMATNRHIMFGIINVIVTIFSLLIAIIIAKYTHSLPDIVYSSLLIDIVLTWYVNHKFNALLIEIEKKISI